VAGLSQNRGISLATAQLSQKLFDKYKKFINSTIESHDIPVGILEACNSRIRQIHGIEVANNSINVDLSITENFLKTATLAVAEKIVFSVHDIEDCDLDPLRKAFGEAGCVQLITALAFFDVECRLELASGVF
tara:strand:- start:2934 stop:3332 length:399 start_codon:yes stop_codon:yes gene_type:complete